MDKKNIPDISAGHLKDICARVEQTYGKPVLTPLQFEALAEDIFRRTGKLLSPTTLKRLWGYLKEPMKPRRSTLDVLAGYCGWHDFEDFTKGYAQEIESGNVGTNVISADKDICKGDRVRLMWPPSRVCEIEYIGERKWRVGSSEGTRLSPGDTFSCAMIVSGEPLYLDNLVHSDDRPGVYVCGRRSGVTFSDISTVSDRST